MPDLEPITREEMLLDGEDLEPITRKEMFIKRIYNKTQVIPEPITREEIFLKKAGDETTDVTIEQLTATENRTYSEEGVAYSPVIVNVPQTTLTTLDVTENGTYTAPSGTAYDEVNVNVPLPENAYLLKDIPNTPTAIASFNDGSDLPMPKLEVGIEPQQDLHGYDAPWVGGAGKNKVPITCDTQTKQGVTYTVYKNEDGAVTKIHAQGTATANHSFSVVDGYSVSNPFMIKAGSYWFKGTSNGVSGQFDFNLRKQGESSDIVQRTDKVSLELSEDTYFQSCYLYVYSGITINTDIYPMIWLKSSPNDDFAPYSNICPISGWDEGNVVVSPTTDAEDGHTTTIPFLDSQGNPIEVYGGKLDVVSGVLTVDRAYVDLGSLNYTYEDTETPKRFRAGLNPPPKLSSELVCSCFKGVVKSVAALNDGECCISGTAAYPWLRIRDDAFTDATAFKTSVNGQQLVYELATPLTIQLTPTQVNSLLGVNNVWADCGDIIDGQYFSKEV